MQGSHPIDSFPAWMVGWRSGAAMTGSGSGCATRSAFPIWRRNAGRLADRAAVDQAVGEKLASVTVAEADAKLAVAGVPAGPVQRVDQVLDHPAVETIAPMHPILGPTPMPGPVLRTATTRSEHAPPPALGQDRDAVLNAVGLGGQAERLTSMGAFGQPK
jgi:crotonobetainyl-CoA:carnitine CoA-transferase CaiB-like acyl-CoA transferase